MIPPQTAANVISTGGDALLSVTGELDLQLGGPPTENVESRRRTGIRILARDRWDDYDPAVIRWRLEGEDRVLHLHQLADLGRASEWSAAARDTVLVVDDTPETLSFLTDTLDQAGFTVLIATDGDSALQLVDQITPDLVLMDALMPGIDGFEACRRLKREKLLSHLPVIFMTGLSDLFNVPVILSSNNCITVVKKTPCGQK